MRDWTWRSRSSTSLTSPEPHPYLCQVRMRPAIMLCLPQTEAHSLCSLLCSLSSMPTAQAVVRCETCLLPLSPSVRIACELQHQLTLLLPQPASPSSKTNFDLVSIIICFRRLGELKKASISCLHKERTLTNTTQTYTPHTCTHL